MQRQLNTLDTPIIIINGNKQHIHVTLRELLDNTSTQIAKITALKDTVDQLKPIFGDTQQTRDYVCLEVIDYIGFNNFLALISPMHCESQLEDERYRNQMKNCILEQVFPGKHSDDFEYLLGKAIYDLSSTLFQHYQMSVEMSNPTNPEFDENSPFNNLSLD